MKTVICFIAIVFFINIGFAQKNLQYDKWILKFSPLSLINPDGPNFHVATEYRFAFRWSAQVDIGLPVKILTFGEKGSKHDANYLNVRSELHYYFANRNNVGYLQFF